jgi:hypothetical protein
MTHKLSRLAKIAFVVSSLAIAPAAMAQWSWWQWPPRRAAPEFDPAAAGAVASLVAGGALLLASRRNRKDK